MRLRWPSSAPIRGRTGQGRETQPTTRHHSHGALADSDALPGGRCGRGASRGLGLLCCPAPTAGRKPNAGGALHDHGPRPNCDSDRIVGRQDPARAARRISRLRRVGPCADAAYRRQGHELERVSRRRGRFGYRVGMETSQVCGGAQGGCVRCRTASGTRSGLAGLHGSLVGLHGSLVGLLSINRTRLPLFALLPPLRPTNTC